ncbi:hypothetical protein RMO59_41720, partial [Streptomyces alfalfae]
MTRRPRKPSDETAARPSGPRPPEEPQAHEGAPAPGGASPDVAGARAAEPADAPEPGKRAKATPAA